MTTLLIRTVLVYVLLIIAMRLMGKRQIGELEISDLVTTLLISEIASLPITDATIPISHAIVPIVTLLTFEVVSSTLLSRFPRIKNLLSARPATLIRDGKLCGREMKQARLSADELISELRQQGITDPAEVRYAILEQNGKISVIPKASCRPPTAKEIKLTVKDTGLYHIIIDKGVFNKHNLKDLQLDQSKLERTLATHGLMPRDVYLMMMNDEGGMEIIRKDETT